MSYIHGYTRDEQERLVAQAEFWRDSLILPDLPYRAGERLLDIGCGCGAVLGVIASAHPGLRLAGLDLSAEQIAAARAHLTALGHPDADLRQGDAVRLPWPDGHFDHVYLMWFLEHLDDPRPALAEAQRVLRPGGTITVNETDYSMFHLHPSHPDVEYLADGQRDLFRRHGQPAAGRALGALLAAAGFRGVRSGPMGFHAFTGPDGQPALRRLADYLLGFLEPMVPRMVDELGLDAERLHAGVARLRALPTLPEGSLTQIVFRARGLR